MHFSRPDSSFRPLVRSPWEKVCSYRTGGRLRISIDGSMGLGWTCLHDWLKLMVNVGEIYQSHGVNHTSPMGSVIRLDILPSEKEVFFFGFRPKDVWFHLESWRHHRPPTSKTRKRQRFILRRCRFFTRKLTRRKMGSSKVRSFHEQYWLVDRLFL